LIDTWKIWVTISEIYFQMFFQTRVGRKFSPGAVFPFAAFKALSISGLLIGIYRISFLIGIISSRVGSAVLGKKLSRSTWAFSVFWTISCFYTIRRGILV
jgi:hypothetical protein